LLGISALPRNGGPHVARLSTCLFPRQYAREASAGDPEAAQERLAVLAALPVLEISEEAVALAKNLIRSGPLPERVEVDALHIAIAVTTLLSGE